MTSKGQRYRKPPPVIVGPEEKNQKLLFDLVLEAAFDYLFKSGREGRVKVGHRGGQRKNRTSKAVKRQSL